MDYQNILVRSGDIARIQLNRPEKRNALSSAMVEELIDALLTLDKSEMCRVIILEGNGKGFCAGGDLSAMDAALGVTDHRASNRGMARLLTALTKIGKIVIAKVHGHALAGGLGLAVGCDMAVFADNAKLGTPEILRSLYPFMISAPLTRCIPQKKLLELCFVGETIAPTEALALGMANRICPPEELEAVVMDLAGKIAKHSPAAIRLGKEAFYTQRDMDYYKSLDYLAECLTTIQGTRDVKEGITAFFEKRDPVWTGK